MDDLANIQKLKVKQLKKELQKRGLDKRGVKEVLAKRLTQAINEERAVDDDSQAENVQVGLHGELKDKNPNDNTNLLLKIYQAVSDINKRLNSLENKFENHIAVISEHVNAQDSLVSNLKDERSNLQTITAELISKKSPSKTTEETFVATIPTANRFDVLDRDTKQNIAKPVMTSEEQLAEYRKRRHDEVTAKQSSLEFDVVIAGDSMLKHIDANRLSRSRKVKCQSNPGAKAEQISPVTICDSLKREGEAIIHVGTNNNMEGPRSVHAKIVSLCEAVATTGRHACISGIIHRRWETPYERKRVDTINHHLQITAQDKGWGFINNASIGDRHLGQDGVHLNKSGQAALAGNLSRYINRHQHRHRNQHPSQARSYADATSGSNGVQRGLRQDFDMEFRRSRLKTAHHQRMSDPMQWWNYLQFVRDTTRGI